MDSISLKNYFKDLRKIQLLSGEKQNEFIKKAQNGDEHALNKIVESNLRFVVSVAKDYTYSGILLEDLISEGNIGLIRAVEKFDETKGFKFISYAVWWVRQAIMQSISDNGTIIRVPVSRKALNNKISRAKNSLSQKLDREPTLEEIGNAFNFSNHDILKSCHSGNAISLDEIIGDESEQYTLSDCLVDADANDTEDNIHNKELGARINNIFEDLSEREATILKMYFGLDDYTELTLKEIGKELNLTNERVRQIKDFALKKLRTYGNSSKLRCFLKPQ